VCAVSDGRSPVLNGLSYCRARGVPFWPCPDGQWHLDVQHREAVAVRSRKRRSSTDKVAGFRAE